MLSNNGYAQQTYTQQHMEDEEKAFPLNTEWNKAVILSVFVQYPLWNIIKTVREEEPIKRIQLDKEVKLLIFSVDTILCLSHHRESLWFINTHIKVAG